MPRQRPSTDVVRGIDRKLRGCMNPIFNNPNGNNNNNDNDKEKETKKLAKLERLAAQEKADMELLLGKG
jgi:hypothetical protein